MFRVLRDLTFHWEPENVDCCGQRDVSGGVGASEREPVIWGNEEPRLRERAPTRENEL